jgi:hypothetical protein
MLSQIQRENSELNFCEMQGNIIELNSVMKMEHKKVLILIASDGTGYRDLVKAIRETWGSSKLDGFEILYYYGYRENYPRPEPGHCIQVNDELICGVGSNDVNSRNKIAFEYIYNNYNFDYLFRCCAGSYVVQNKLEQFLVDKPKTKYYAGPLNLITFSKDDIMPFAVGLGVIFSRDLVKLLNDNPSGFLCHAHEDVAFGKFFRENGITYNKVPTRCRFSNINELEENQFQYHIRNNVSMMNEIHQKLGLGI